MSKLRQRDTRVLVVVTVMLTALLVVCDLAAPGTAFASTEGLTANDGQVTQTEGQEGLQATAAAPQGAAEQTPSKPSSQPPEQTVGNSGDPSTNAASSTDLNAGPVPVSPASDTATTGEEATPTQPTELPKLTGFAIISGNTKVGTTLIAGVEGAPENAVLTYQWYRGDSPIAGAIANTYTTTQEDNGCDITCRVSAAGYQGVLISGAIRPLAPAEPQAFAVYCDDDKSLNFYKRSSVPNAGDTFEGKTVTAVYTGIETAAYDAASVPWADHARTILSVLVADDGIAPVSTAYWFYVFNACTSLDVTRLDTSNVTDMMEMFDACCSLPFLDVSHFDTSKVTNMSWMFATCELLTELDLSGWDTSNVTDMEGMFNYSCSLTELDVSAFNTSNVTSMLAMFEGCQALKTLNLLDWDTSNVVDIQELFCDCSNLTVLDLSGFDLSKVTSAHSLFSFCPSLTTIYVAPSADWAGIFEQFGYMFENSPALVGGMGTTYEREKCGGEYARIDGSDGKPGYFTPKITVSYFDPATGATSTPVLYIYGLKAAESALEGFWGWATTPDAQSPTFLPGETVLYDPANITNIVLYPVEKPTLTGYVVLVGSTKIGTVITATVEDAPENTTFTYQWYRGDNPIAGATANTYTTTQEDNGCDITCKVSATGYQGELVSGAIRPFSPVPPTQNITVEYWGYTDASPDAQVLLKTETANLTDVFNYRYDQNTDADKTNDRVPYKLLGWQAEGSPDYYDVTIPESEFTTTLQEIATLVGWSNNAPLVFHAVQEVRQITVYYWGGGYEEDHDLEPVKVMSWFDVPYIEGLEWKGYLFESQTEDWGYELDSSMTCGYILTELTQEPWSDEMNVYLNWLMLCYQINFISPNGLTESVNFFYEDEIELLMSGLLVVYPGHEFVGWFTEPDGAGVQVVSGTKYCDIEADDQVESRNLYAYFTQLDLTGSVQIAGTVNVGDTLTATVDGIPSDAHLQYQWYRGASPIMGATKTSYTLVNEDVGANISCRVTDNGYKGTLISNTIGPIEGLETEAFAIYSEADNSLNFYKRASIPAVGDIFAGKSVTALYTDFEASAANANWKEYASTIVSVAVIDNGIQPSSISKWFEGFVNCSHMDLLRLDTSKVKVMSFAFEGCSNLECLDVSGFDTSNVTMMSGMFSGCSKLVSLDVSTFNTSQLVSITGMFKDCVSLAQLSLPTASMACLRGLVQTFQNCTSLITLDLSGIAPTNGYNALRMCDGCTALTTIYTASDADWSSISAIDSSGDLFSNCPNLVGGNGTQFDADKTGPDYARVDGLDGSPGYFTAKS